jgi:hypothetical protein
MERARKADEDDEGQAQEDNRKTKSSDFDRRSKVRAHVRHCHMVALSSHHHPSASFNTRVSSCRLTPSVSDFYCRSLLLRQRNSRLYLARPTLSTYNLDAASAAAMGQPSKLDKPSPGGAHSLASTLNSPDPTFVEKLA